MGIAELRAKLSQLDIAACKSMSKKGLQQLLKMAIDLQQTQTSAADPVVDIPSAFLCQICSAEFSSTETGRIPRLLGCGHSACSSCLMRMRTQRLLEGASFTYIIRCPVCRISWPVRNVKSLPKNFTAIDMMYSMKREMLNGASNPSKRRRSNDSVANAIRMHELLEGRPGIAKDSAQAFQMAEAGSHAGCIHSRGVLGRCYITGTGVERDVRRGWQLGKESADAGSAYGELVVAIAYEEGIGGVARDLEEAEQHYQVAETNGISEAKFRLARIRMQKQSSFGIPTEEMLVLRKEVINMLRSAVGHSDSQIFLADMLLKSFQFSKDAEELEEALAILKLALDQGTASAHVKGLALISDIYEYHKDDFSEAFKYVKQSSDRGCRKSTLRLANMYRLGKGTTRDASKAIGLLKRLIDPTSPNFADDEHDFGKIHQNLRDVYLEIGNNPEALKWCKAGADLGCDECQFETGCMYEGLDPRYECLRNFDDRVCLEGDSIEIDFCAAAKYYQKSSASRFPNDDGTISLARMYEEGLGVEQSFSEAERLLQLVGDNVDAKFRLAHLYEHGRAGAIAKDELKALAIYQELVDDWDDECASCRLACMYRDGRGVPQDRSRAYEILSNEEVNEDAGVCYLHASMLLEEADGPNRNASKALRLLEKAVQEDHTDAQYLLGHQLEDNRPRRAIKLLKKASKKHHVEATFRLACLIYEGKGIAQNYEAAAKLFMEIVAKGHVEACVHLAEMHECGNGVAQNIDIAVMLLASAAEKGNSRAQSRLARLYKDGCSVIQNKKKAFELFRLAALQGVPQAQFELACMYLHGTGTVRILSEAIRWMRNAAAQGNAQAIPALRLLRMLHPDQVDEN